MKDLISWLEETGYKPVEPILGNQVWKNVNNQKIVVWHEHEGLKSMHDISERNDEDVFIDIYNHLKNKSKK